MKSILPFASTSLTIVSTAITLEAVQSHTKDLATLATSEPEVWKANLNLARAQMIPDVEIQEAEARLNLAEAMVDSNYPPANRAAAFERAQETLGQATRQRLQVLAGGIVEIAAGVGEARAIMNQLATKIAEDEETVAELQKALDAFDNPVEPKDPPAVKALKKEARLIHKFWNEHNQDTTQDLIDSLRELEMRGGVKCDHTEGGFLRRKREIAEEIDAVYAAMDAPVTDPWEARERLAPIRLKEKSLRQSIGDSRPELEAATQLVEMREAELAAALGACDPEVKRVLRCFELEAKSLALMAGQVTTAGALPG